jgi:hypothetical protein
LLISREFFLALVGAWVKGGVINIWPVKPFETVIVIKGYTNKIEFNLIESTFLGERS